jgi:tetratricopeptide (TPR) repeat protein
MKTHTTRMLTAAVLVLGLGAAARAQVTVREEPLVIPTWEIGPPAVHPLFPAPQGPIYPYTQNDTLTDRKVDRTYQAVTLENEYVRVLVLPEIGGRVHGAKDKTNGYAWLYWQPTIKPGLISMTGAWISGGIEWNFPHGHRPSGFMPVDHRVVKNADGSATVWVGETEPVYRMRWIIGLTLFPGRSYLRCDYVFVNPTDHRNPFQFWATGATHANESAQAQYPGEVVTGHGKEEFWHWPVHDGLDLSWWKNVANASSFFAWQSQDDWFGTFDHGKNAGTLHVADHRVMPGKKLWTWGSGPSGRIWEDILTEGGGAYYEPQAGAFSDNQPDYHWMEPDEVRTAHDYWYPVRDTRGFRKANQDFALNVDVASGKAFAGVYATGAFDGVKVALVDTRSGKALVDTTVRVAPDKPFTAEVAAPAGLSLYDLALTVKDPNGTERLALAPKKPGDAALPAPAAAPPDPAKATADELYAWGEWLDRFIRRPEALAYYREALRRDPKDVRVNVEMGGIALKEARFADALRHLDTALERDSANARAQLGRGQALVGLGRHAEAEEAFAKASLGADQQAAADLALARLSLRRRDTGAALERLRAAGSRNGLFADIPALRAAALRLAGDKEKALAAAEEALALDPMHFMGGYEKTLALRNLGRAADEWEATRRAYMRDSVENAIELATAYVQSGLLADADLVLADAAAADTGAVEPPAVYSARRTSAMVQYLRGWLAQQRGDGAAAAVLFARGKAGPLVYTNPHRVEELVALEAAAAADPKDAHARHLLGNVLYGLGRRDDGLVQWKQAVALDDTLALSWRNIAWAERQVHEDDRASAEAYRKAFAIDPSDARVLLELDQTAERLRVPAAERRALLDAHRATVDERDDLTLRWIDVTLAGGGSADLEPVRQALLTRHFHTWEGMYGIHQAFMDVHQRLGDMALERKDLKGALALYQKAFEYPRNLEVAPRTPDFRAHLNWSVAHAYLASGRRDAARPYLDRILAEKYDRPGFGTYYQALAEEARGHTAASQALVAQLEKRARAMTGGPDDRRGRTGTAGWYLLSLALEAKGDGAGAKDAMQKALERDAQPARAALTMAQVEFAGAHQ